ncbi:MAG: copper-containing nitrite reductase [Chloroflexi bacterium]|nr:copper-containing nitrite reductase [Chloroflexota bacterium]MDA1146392.1 copper-containing nitrite reductase [Chloroflexota bacterium]
MTVLTEMLGRRRLMQRLAMAGVALPLVGAVGCTSDDTIEARDAAQRAVVDRANATPTATSEAASVAQGGGSTSAPIVQDAVNLEYLPVAEMPGPINRSEPATVQVSLEVQELDGKLADGVGYHFWTFNGTIPGPMIRARQGDDVELTLTNPTESTLAHNIDLHAVTGPGGGATLTGVAKGETKAFRFKAMHPGVYIYHCATPPIDLHISAGMYGLIVIEPPEGLPPVDREFYVCQGEIYTSGKAGEPGMQPFDLERMSAENPSYVVFNGAVGSVTGDRALKANVGERVRIFFGVGGPNKTSSFHVIGEIFDRAATWGSFSSMAESVQTVSVAPGGATMVEFDLEVPGTFLLVDHALSRLPKGAGGHLVVEGPEAPEIFTQIEA